MSERDRMKRVRLTLNRMPAQWEDHAYRHADGTERIHYWTMPRMTERDALIMFSNTLCGRHHNLTAHLRDMRPLDHDDPNADIAIDIMRDIDPNTLRLFPDDPKGFRDIWTILNDSPTPGFSILNDPNRSLLDEEDSFACHWHTMRLRDAYADWGERLDLALHPRLACRVIIADPLSAIVDVDGVDATILLEPDDPDWRHGNAGIHGIIIHGHDRTGVKWHQTPTRLAGGILRLAREGRRS